MITLNQLKRILGFKSDALCLNWYVPMINVFEKYDITSNKRIAMFLAQCEHESNNFTVLSENLNYSADGLMKTFKKYFPTIESTYDYMRNPQAIANKVYANRMGNGDENSGDGWAFRGRGLIQLTGRDNYQSFADSINKDIYDVIEYLGTNEGALESAAWFWNKTNLNMYSDTGDVKKVTQAINGGQNGYDDRLKRYNTNIAILTS